MTNTKTAKSKVEEFLLIILGFLNGREESIEYLQLNFEVKFLANEFDFLKNALTVSDHVVHNSRFIKEEERRVCILN